MFLEDPREQEEHREVFSQLIKETALFKVELELTDELQERLEFVEWQAKVVAVDSRSNDVKVGDEEPVDIGKLQALLEEG